MSAPWGAYRGRPGTDRTAYLVLLNEFERIARREGAVYTREAFTGPDLDRRLQLWRRVASIDPETVNFLPLSNKWQFKPDLHVKGIDEAWFAADLDDTDWGTVRSDLGHKGWESQGYSEYEIGYGWYRQTFECPEDTASLENLRLFFGAVDEQADIWINGTKVLSHTTETLRLSKDFLWKTPFHFDAKPFLKPGEPNQLTVRVHNAHHVGGIWRPVYLVWGEPVDDLHALGDFLRRQSTAR